MLFFGEVVLLEVGILEPLPSSLLEQFREPKPPQ